MKGIVLHYRNISVDYTDYPHIITPENAINFTSYGLNSSSLSNTSSVLDAPTFDNLTILNSTILSKQSPHVGSLPVTRFIYTLTGGLVFLICLPSVIAFFKLISQAWRNRFRDQDIEDGGQMPKFLEKHARPRPSYGTMIDAAIKRQQQYDPSTSITAAFRPNYPLPVAMAASEENETRPVIVTLEDIMKFREMVEEKAQLDRALVNLRRLDGVQKASGVGSGVATSKKISEIMYKRAQLIVAINTAMEKFRTLRGTLSDHEWAAIEQIKRLL